MPSIVRSCTSFQERHFPKSRVVPYVLHKHRNKSNLHLESYTWLFQGFSTLVSYAKHHITLVLKLSLFSFDKCWTARLQVEVEAWTVLSSCYVEDICFTETSYRQPAALPESGAQAPVPSTYR
jgi:hypothetical protein